MDTLLSHLYAVAYAVSDWQRAKKFYGETLGLPVAAFMYDEGGFIEYGAKDGTHLAINLWRGPGAIPHGEGNAVAIFSVDDVSQTVAELRRRGVRCDEPVIMPGVVTTAYFYDPDGNRLELAGPAPQA